MRTLVDTCVLSELQGRRPNAQVRERFVALDADDMYFSVLTTGELRKGIDKLPASAKKTTLAKWYEQLVTAARDHILPIDQETAAIWGAIAARSESEGKSIPPIDGLIAATALQHGLQLMTRNTADFASTGVLLTNPWE